MEKIKKNTVYNMDALKLLPQIKNKSIDMVCTDPVCRISVKYKDGLDKYLALVNGLSESRRV